MLLLSARLRLPLCSNVVQNKSGAIRHGTSTSIQNINKLQYHASCSARLADWLGDNDQAQTDYNHVVRSSETGNFQIAKKDGKLTVFSRTLTAEGHDISHLTFNPPGWGILR